MSDHEDEVVAAKPRRRLRKVAELEVRSPSPRRSVSIRSQRMGSRGTLGWAIDGALGGAVAAGRYARGAEHRTLGPIRAHRSAYAIPHPTSRIRHTPGDSGSARAWRCGRGLTPKPYTPCRVDSPSSTGVSLTRLAARTRPQARLTADGQAAPWRGDKPSEPTVQCRVGDGCYRNPQRVPYLHGPSAVELSATLFVRAAGKQRRAVAAHIPTGGWPDAASLPQRAHATVQLSMQRE